MKAIRLFIMAVALASLAACASDDGGLCGGTFKSEVEMERALGRAAKPDPNVATVHY